MEIREMHVQFWWGTRKERDLSDDLGVGDRLILKFILKGQDGLLWTRLIWLRIGTSGRLL
jgi:hypothetical protein